MDGPRIRAVKRVLRSTHGCDGRFANDVPVGLTWEGPKLELFDGMRTLQARCGVELPVAVFDLVGPATASRYAWEHPAEDGTSTRLVVRLHDARVDSPRAAVRATLDEEGRTDARVE